MNKGTLILIVVLLMSFPGFVSAATLQAAFQYPEEINVTEFRMFERTEEGAIQVASVAGTERAMTWEQEFDDTVCHTYFMTSVVGELSSQPSNPYGWCPETVLPSVIVRPGNKIQFTIEVIE